MAKDGPFTNLQLVDRVDVWPYFTKDPGQYKKFMEPYFYFMIEGFTKPFGYIHRGFVRQLEWPDFWVINADKRFVTLTSGNDFNTRTQLVQETLVKGHEPGSVPILKRLSKENFPLYDSNGQHVLDMDGAGLDLFGVANFSVHLIAWVNTDEGIKYWIPRRAGRMSYPNMLDNTVGGSLRTGEAPMECIVRECEEEIRLDPAYTREHIRACGTASYQMAANECGSPGCQLQTQYLYEMELRADIVPRIGDGEVAELALMTIEEVRDSMRNGEFKLNCNMTWLAFLIRHGHLTAENEPDFLEICARLHRRHDLFIS
ncbi:hypothetical protein SLS64_007086 [Diaporthe eres]|uniref:Nudix hydrolase domain-containing protein n=1 Tax=Diaporthe eres TaxID=83184 RepID=A0ABR1PHM6_DIAER